LWRWRPTFVPMFWRPFRWPGGIWFSILAIFASYDSSCHLHARFLILAHLTIFWISQSCRVVLIANSIPQSVASDATVLKSSFPLFFSRRSTMLLCQWRASLSLFPWYGNSRERTIRFELTRKSQRHMLDT
jgi:hypothetical protein